MVPWPARPQRCEGGGPLPSFASELAQSQGTQYVVRLEQCSIFVCQDCSGTQWVLLRRQQASMHTLAPHASASHAARAPRARSMRCNQAAKSTFAATFTAEDLQQLECGSNEVLGGGVGGRGAACQHMAAYAQHLPSHCLQAASRMYLAKWQGQGSDVRRPIDRYVRERARGRAATTACDA